MKAQDEIISININTSSINIHVFFHDFITEQIEDALNSALKNICFLNISNKYKQKK